MSVVAVMAAVVASVSATTSVFRIGTDDVGLELNLDTCMATLVITDSDNGGSGATDGAVSITGRGDGRPAVRGDPVPLVQLYNRVSDGLPLNLEACTGVTVVQPSTSTSGSLDVTAANGYGHVRLHYTVLSNLSTTGEHGDPTPSPVRVYFTVGDTSEWHADPVEKHLAFGEFWTGVIDPTKAPLVMGKLQGAVALPQTGEASSGYVTVSSRSYYRYIFYAQPGDTVVFGWVGSPGRPASVWQAVATDMAIAPPSANRHHTWLWAFDFNEDTAEQYADIGTALGVDVLMASGWDTLYLTISNTSFPHGVAQTVAALEKRGLSLGLHMHPDIVWPCATTERLDCLESGVDISPVVLECPECLIPEGLAPTYRSGDLLNLRTSPTEDLGFWWGHDKKGPSAFGGNQQPCGQGSCNARDWNFTWVPNMTLVQTEWSKVGRYRDGGAILFGGNESSFGTIPGWSVFDSARTGITVGLVAHPLPQQQNSLHGASVQCLFERIGVFSLCLDAENRLTWTVQTESGQPITCQGKQALTPGALASYVVRASFNGTSGTAHVFVDGVLDTTCGGSRAGTRHGVSLATATPNEPITVGRGLFGAVEELYIKNVSTENRVGYIYADDNRVLGTYLLDLSRPAGQAYFAKTVSTAVNTATPVAVQYDGFEKMALIAGQDFDHSKQTWTSGLYRGHPTPDWYHFEGWPLRWGLGVLQAMTLAHDAMRIDTAVEASFMAPGLGPWRPDMAPYVDERGDFVDLGLEWHPKLLYRIQLTGTIINGYDTTLSKFTSQFDVDYFFGGLVTGGIPPQPAMGAPSTWPALKQYAGAIKRWMQRYRRFGYATEDAVTTLVYDTQCCHVQGICEWVACRDAVAVELFGGNGTAAALGLYVGTNATFTIPPNLLAGRELLVFQAASVVAADVTLGESADTDFQVRFMSPVSPTVLRLGGGWWVLENQNVREIVSAENGTVLSTRLVFPHAVSGQQAYTFTHDQSDSWGPGGFVTLTKEN